eukprot:1195384-Prorocentrum_minimum.AAC.1
MEWVGCPGTRKVLSLPLPLISTSPRDSSCSSKGRSSTVEWESCADTKMPSMDSWPQGVDSGPQGVDSGPQGVDSMLGIYARY